MSAKKPRFGWATPAPTAGIVDLIEPGTWARTPKVAVYDSRVTPAMLRVLCVLGIRCDEFGYVRHTTPAWIAMKLGMTKGRGHVQRHLRELEKLGYVARGWEYRHDRGGFDVNVYRLAFPKPLDGGDDEIATSEPEIANEGDAANSAASAGTEPVLTGSDAANSAARVPPTARLGGRDERGKGAANSAAPLSNPASSTPVFLPCNSSPGADDGFEKSKATPSADEQAAAFALVAEELGKNELAFEDKQAIDSLLRARCHLNADIVSTLRKATNRRPVTRITKPIRDAILKARDKRLMNNAAFDAKLEGNSE